MLISSMVGLNTRSTMDIDMWADVSDRDRCGFYEKEWNSRTNRLKGW